MSTRRHVLQWLAAAPALASCGGDNLPDPVAAWRAPGAAEQDPRRFALAHAILAPNPHNTQPWLVDLDDSNGMVLYCDLERRLPFTDPLDRQVTIGCGAFLYLYWIALFQRGFGCNFEFFPDGAPEVGARLDARPLVRARAVALPPGEPAQQHYFAHITTRRTNRNLYDTRIPSAAALERIGATALDWANETPPLTAHWEADSARVAPIRDLVWRAFDREMRTRGAQEETYGWLRFGREAIARNPDGLAIDGPMIPLLKTLGFLDRDDLLNPNSTASKQTADDWRRKAEAAPAFMWLNSADDAPLTRLLSGFAYARMNLAATAAGLAIHPWSQALEEYDEMAELYAEARRLLGAETATIQMLVRVGYAEPVPPSARRGVDAILRG